MKSKHQELNAIPAFTREQQDFIAFLFAQKRGTIWRYMGIEATIVGGIPYMNRQHFANLFEDCPSSFNRERWNRLARYQKNKGAK